MVAPGCSHKLSASIVQISAKEKIKSNYKAGNRRLGDVQVTAKNGGETQDVAHKSASRTDNRFSSYLRTNRTKNSYHLRRLAKFLDLNAKLITSRHGLSYTFHVCAELFMFLKPARGRIVLKSMIWTTLGWISSANTTCVIASASITKLAVSETITFHNGVAKSRAPVTLRKVNELVVPVLLGKAFTDKVIRSVHPAGTRIVLHRSLSVPNLMVHKASCAAGKEKPDNG